MLDGMRRVPNIFGTCAGAIMLAKTIAGQADGQDSLRLMDIEADRNAYGRQSESFQAEIDTTIGPTSAVFIRAPKITHLGTNVRSLARFGNEVIACEEVVAGSYYLALSFHPELTTTLFHEYFLKKIQ
jgi:5'-phosphate synthase pdxT subunit